MQKEKAMASRAAWLRRKAKDKIKRDEKRAEQEDAKTNADSIQEHEIRSQITREHRRGLTPRAIAGGLSAIHGKEITTEYVNRVLEQDLKRITNLSPDIFQAPPKGQLHLGAEKDDLKERLRQERMQSNERDLQRHFERVEHFKNFLPPQPITPSSSPLPPTSSSQMTINEQGEEYIGAEEFIEVKEEDINPRLKAALEMPSDALRYYVFKLRKEGKSYIEIQQITGVEQKLARRWVSVELSILDGDELKNRDLARRMQLERTEALLSAVWTQATRQPTEEFPQQGPDLEAARTALRILERQSKLLGLDSPPKVDIEERVRLMARRIGVDEDEVLSYAIETIQHKILPS